MAGRSSDVRPASDGADPFRAPWRLVDHSFGAVPARPQPKTAASRTIDTTRTGMRSGWSRNARFDCTYRDVRVALPRQPMESTRRQLSVLPAGRAQSNRAPEERHMRLAIGLCGAVLAVSVSVTTPIPIRAISGSADTQPEAVTLTLLPGLPLSAPSRFAIVNLSGYSTATAPPLQALHSSVLFPRDARQRTSPPGR